MSVRKWLHPQRLGKSEKLREDPRDEFSSDRSRIVFSSSFRRMMKKAQVFSLEENSSVRNRLTHSLEVADVGRTLARDVGRRLEEKRQGTPEDTECLVSVVENACILHDIGNPPFGHFGEEAIKSWFHEKVRAIEKQETSIRVLSEPKAQLADFLNFDGNPQGFRIATRLHSELEPHSLNLTCSTLLATIKYPHTIPPSKGILFGKKQGVFKSEEDRYCAIRECCGTLSGKRYFLAYLMELADDVCYCLSDIADSFEKCIIGSRDYKAEMGRICKRGSVDARRLVPSEKITSFSHQVAIPLSREARMQGATLFANSIDKYLAGEADELLESIQCGRELKCLKAFAKQFIYTSPEAQRIEIAGSRIVRGLLDHFGMLLDVPASDFRGFVREAEMRKDSGLDIHWRVYNQLSKRMLRVYEERVKKSRSQDDEWIARAKLIVDYVSGLTDDSARDVFQNFMGISV